MDEKLRDLLNQQIGKEFYSAYLYLSMSNYYYHASLDGFGKWYKIQAQEEMDHGNKIIKYLLDREQIVKMDAIDAPKWDFQNYREPIEMALKHEEYVTGLINDLYGLAKDVRDWRSCQFLDWYLAEQTEEEKNAHDMINRYDLSGADPRGIFLLDEYLNRREYQPIDKV
ncbi:MAG: ferritin [Desulfovibrio sp.]|nr:ferritin [Desulfovibrio sp.]